MSAYKNGKPKIEEIDEEENTPSKPVFTGIGNLASLALSYSKDLCVGKIIEFKDLTNTADVLLDWLKNNQ
jgi:hypothetical protein